MISTLLITQRDSQTHIADSSAWFTALCCDTVLQILCTQGDDFLRVDVCKEIKSDIIILPGRSAGFAFQGIAVSLSFLIKFCKGGHIGIFLMLWDKSAVIVLGKIGEGAVLFHKAIADIFVFSLQYRRAAPAGKRCVQPMVSCAYPLIWQHFHSRLVISYWFTLLFFLKNRYKKYAHSLHRCREMWYNIDGDYCIIHCVCGNGKMFRRSVLQALASFHYLHIWYHKSIYKVYHRLFISSKVFDHKKNCL